MPSVISKLIVVMPYNSLCRTAFQPSDSRDYFVAACARPLKDGTADALMLVFETRRRAAH